MAMVRAAASASAASSAATEWAEGLGGGQGDDPGRPGRQTCWAVWHEELAVFEVLQPRGDSLRSLGTTWRSRLMLHAEEGLWLVERGMLAVHPFSLAPKKTHDPTGTASPAEPSSGIGRKDDAREMHDETGSSSSTPEITQDMRNIEYEEKENDGGGQEGLTDDVGSSAGKNACPILPRAELSPIDSGVILTGEPQHSLDHVASGETARTGQGGGCRKVPTAAKEGRQRVGCKRSRPGQGRDERVVRPAPALSVSVSTLYEMVLSRAGVPWECYRAYAELKRRSYVVRRQPEDTVGYDDTAPRAAPLSWFQGTGNAKTSNNNLITAASHTSSPSSSLPVTFHVYNNPSGCSSSFRKRDPGPPDALLVVCHFGDPMPDHCSLVALIELHANMQMKRSMSQQWRRQGREDGTAGIVADLGPDEAAPDRDSGSQEVPASGLESERVTSSGGQDSDQKGTLLDEDRQKRQAGKVPDLETGLDRRRTRGRLTTEGSGGSTLALSEGVEKLSTPGIKLAVVSGEAQVQLFDVGLHDAREAAELPS
ncbi:unnamed protein product [Ectocarpus sp. 13 AM-2016]